MSFLHHSLNRISPWWDEIYSSWHQMVTSLVSPRKMRHGVSPARAILFKNWIYSVAAELPGLPSQNLR